jgi:hypothetical protein
MRAKCIIVTSKISGESLIINSKLAQKNCFGLNEDKEFVPLMVSKLEQFEYKNEEYFAVGLRDGTVLIKQGEQIMSKNNYAIVEPP